MEQEDEWACCDRDGLTERKPHPAVPQMDNRRHLPPGWGGDPKLSTSAFQTQHEAIRQVKREAGDPVTSTHVRKEELSDVPCKVPRFQYVDFPSLHQCIKQLSVPPLEGWLTSCPLGRVPTRQPTSPKEKAPKFKYVDYPSLHRCIQQLSVPPLEIWSSGLARSGSREGQGNATGQQNLSQVSKSKRENQNIYGNWAEQETGNGTTAPVQNTEPVVPQQIRNMLPLKRAGNWDIEPDNTSQKQSGAESDCGLRSELGSRLESARSKSELRPSVISMVRTEWQKHDAGSEAWKILDPGAEVEQKKVPESVCPFCQQMFTDPEELRNHQRSHKDKRLH